MSVSADDWFDSHQTGSLGLVCGGCPDTFRDWVLRSTSRKAIVFVAHKNATAFNAHLVLDPNPALEIVPSRGLTTDFSRLLERPPGRHPVFLSDTVQHYFTLEVRSLGQRLDMLTGYEHPLGLVTGAVRDRLAKLLNTYCEGPNPSVLMHDVEGALRHATLSRADISIAGETGFAGTAAHDGEHHLASAPIGLVQNHIEFIARTDMKTLS